VPSLKEVSTSTAFLDPTQPPEHSKVFLDGIPYIKRTPVIATWTEIEDAAEEILTRAFYEDGYTIDDAIEELDAATEPLFEEARAP
jgi:multiple sugar transport system substrate-binding protein